MGTSSDRHRLRNRLLSLFPDEDNTGFTPLDLVHKFGSPLMALLYSELFWPHFREVEGMVFLADRIEDSEDEAEVAATLDKLGSRTEVEKRFNFVAVPELFGRMARQSTDEEDEWLATRLQEMWSARLGQCYPSRCFEVRVAPATEDGDEIGILFFERHN